METKRILSFFLALCLLFTLTATPASAAGLFDPPEESAYWHNLTADQGDMLLRDMVRGTVEEDTIFVYYSQGCGYSRYYVPLFAQFANEKQVEMYAFGYDPFTPEVNITLTSAILPEGDGTVYWPAVWLYSKQEGTFSMCNGARSMEQLESFLTEHGLYDPAGVPTPEPEPTAAPTPAPAATPTPGPQATPPVSDPNGNGFAIFSLPPESQYWHNLNQTDANQLLASMYNKQESKSAIFVFYSFACGFSKQAIPQIAQFANEEQVEIYAYGKPTAGTGSNLLIYGNMIEGATSLGYPMVFTYNAQTNKYLCKDSVRSIDTLKDFLQDQGLYGSGFTDVRQGDWYYDAVLWAVDNGITAGMSPGRFEPSGSCTRAQAVTFLWRAAGEPDPSIANPFQDVKESDWYYKAVLWAVEKQITKGTTATTFGPEAKCTRGQIVTFLYRFMNQPAVGGGSGFQDVPQDLYCADAVSWAVSAGITNGTSGTTFSPNQNCTRGQIATFLYRTLK